MFALAWPNILVSYTPANHRLGCGAGSARYARETHHVYRGRPDLPGVCASHANPRIISWWPNGDGWKIQEVSRVGAHGVTSKSKLLTLEMLRLCSAGLHVD